MKKNTVISASIAAALWLCMVLFAWFGPRQEISEWERRKLEQMPKLNTESVLSGSFMSHFETFTQDQFPLRDRFRQMKALFSYDILRKGDNNGIYVAQGYAAKLEYPLNEKSIQGAAGKFQKIYDLYLKDNSGKIVLSVVPDKGFYLAQQNGYPAMDYERLFEIMQSLEWAEYVDITDCLSIDSYYTTDTHWRQEKLYPIVKKLADSLDADFSGVYTKKELERPFYGVYYGQAALPMQPETMTILESELLSSCIVTNAENDRVTNVYDMEKLSERDMYDVYLSGAVSVLTIENPNARTDRELLMFRDSFGSSLAPWLVPGYAKITLIDTRYVPTAYLPQFVDFHGQDVLFLYSPLVLNHSAMLK